MSQKSPVKCFRCQPTFKGSSVICPSYGTNFDLPLHSVRQDPPRTGAETELGLWWMSLSASFGPTMTRCSSRTLGRMIWAMLLPDLTYRCRGTQYVAQAEFGEWHLVILLKVHLLPCPSSALVISRSKRLFIICNMWCSDPTERERGRGSEKGKRRARGNRVAFSS